MKPFKESNRQQTKQDQRFSTDKPLLSGYIYQIQQGEVKKVVSAGSFKRMGLTGNWKILREFKNEIE